MTTEIDLHGMRLEEAEAEVTRFLDGLFYRREGSARIIHGFGVISENLPRWLKNSPYVKSFEHPPFNDGVTLVFLC